MNGITTCTSGTATVYMHTLEDTVRHTFSYDSFDGEYIVSCRLEEIFSGYMPKQIVEKRVHRLFNFIDTLETDTPCEYYVFLDDDAWRIIMKALVKGAKVVLKPREIHIDDIMIINANSFGIAICPAKNRNAALSCSDLEQLLDDFNIIEGESDEQAENRFHAMVSKFLGTELECIDMEETEVCMAG